MLPYLALVAAILTGVGGQLLLKAGAGAEDFAAQLLRLQTIAGLGLYGLAAFFYIIALRKIPVSIAFPSVSVSYALVAVLGHLLWNEPFGLAQIAGIALIAGGVLLLYQA
jgi:undecaprenyl phosphate-alpha-L-ara4N flippase subunit ArnE